MFNVPSFFGGDTGVTYEQLQERKRIARELMGDQGQVRTVGEGINQASSAIAGALMNKKAAKEESKQRDAFNTDFNAAISGMLGGYTPRGSSMTAPTVQPISAGPGGTSEGLTPQAQDQWNALMTPKSFDATGVSAPAQAAWDALSGSWGQPLKVTSAYRSPEHNAKVGGAKGSQHMHGNAFDVDVSNMPIEQRQQLIQQARAAGFNGIGVYDNSLHFDVGGERAWGPSYHRDSLPQWAAGAVSSPSGRMSTQGVQTAQMGGLDPAVLAQLSGLASNPYATPGQQAIVQALIGQQLQAMQPADPMDALQQEKMRLEIDAMRNPQARQPDYKFIDGVGMVDMNNPPQSVMAGQFKGSPQDPTEYGVTPQYITRPDGSLGMVVLGKDGSAKEVDLPEGVALQKGVEKLDLGTTWQWYNTVTGEPIGQPIPKDLAGAEREKATGKAEGEDAVASVQNLPKVEAQAEEALALIDSIINDPALPSITGNIQGRLPAGTPFIGGGQAGANLDAKVKQLQGQVFLQAYESLRGAQAITDIEGKKAEEAKARLARTQDDKVYRDSLLELRNIVAAGLERARAKAGVKSTGPQTFEEFAANPEAQAIANQYGVTLEEMWEQRKAMGQ